MYWAVRQICMAKHLRSRRWWGGGFVSIKTSTTDDFHYCIFAFFQHPITARINWLCYLSFKSQCRGCWLFLPPLYALISCLFCVLRTHKALFLLRGFNTFCNLQVKKKTSRSVAFEKDGHLQRAIRCVIRIYTLAYRRRCPGSPLSLHNRPVSGQGAWENVTLPWVRLMGVNHAFQIHYGTLFFHWAFSLLSIQSWEWDVWGCINGQTAYIFHDMCVVLLRGPAEMLGSLSVSVLSYMLARQRTQNGKCVSVRGNIVEVTSGCP